MRKRKVRLRQTILRQGGLPAEAFDDQERSTATKNGLDSTGHLDDLSRHIGSLVRH